MTSTPIQVHTTVNGQDVTAGTLFTQSMSWRRASHMPVKPYGNEQSLVAIAYT